MSRLMLLCLAGGLALTIVLVVATGWADILAAVRSVGWWLLAITGVRLVELALAGIAWGCLLGNDVLRRPWLYVGVRLVRESINALLPVLQVGGDLVGGRLLTFRGVPAGPAAASVLVDILIQASTQFAFTAVGLVALVLTVGGGPVARWAGVGLLVFAPALLGFFLAQRYGLLRLVEGWLIRAGQRWPQASLGPGIRLHEAVQRVYRRPGRLLVSALVHLTGWFVCVAEVWIALAAMGHEPSLASALVIESLGQAVRGAAFAIPGALGVQEGGYVLVGALFGVPPSTAVALSLVKRVPDLATGIPGLLAWQVLETRRSLGGVSRRPGRA